MLPAPLRLSLLVISAATSLLAGCQGQAPRRALKEVYVEAYRLEPVVHKVAYPLEPESEGRAFAAVRPFQDDPLVESRTKLGLLLGQTPQAGDPEPFEPDLSDFPAQNPPSLLVFPDLAEQREGSACYVGHAAYRGDAGGPFLHHVRLRVLNRLPRTVRLPLKEVRLAVAAGDDPQASVAGSERAQVAAVGADGAPLDVLVIRAGEDQLAHVFFSDDRMPAGLRLSWRAVLAPDLGEGGPAPRAWDQGVTLTRRYVLAEGILTRLERRVADGRPLTPQAPPEGWTEPRMTPVTPR